MSPLSEDRYRARPVRCFACKARAQAHRRFGDRPEDSDGLFFSVEEIEPLP
jgi:hypothetical protein